MTSELSSMLTKWFHKSSCKRCIGKDMHQAIQAEPGISHQTRWLAGGLWA